MFAAQLNGKLTRSDVAMEDLLTSNVFGVWRYLPVELGLKQFLTTAENLDGDRIGGIEQAVRANSEFWQRKDFPGCKPAQPDVLIEIVCSDERRILLLVEAKYHSPKSSLRDESPLPNDQLAKEMLVLRREADLRHINRYGLVYVTADSSMPIADLEEAIDELIDKNRDGDRQSFFWTTWYRLPAILADEGLQQRAREASEGYEKMMQDLHQILCDLDFGTFEGIHSTGWTLGCPLWRFAAADMRFAWHAISMGDVAYRFNSYRRI